MESLKLWTTVMQNLADGAHTIGTTKPVHSSKLPHFRATVSAVVAATRLLNSMSRIRSEQQSITMSSGSQINISQLETDSRTSARSDVDNSAATYQNDKHLLDDTEIISGDRKRVKADD